MDLLELETKLLMMVICISFASCTNKIDSINMNQLCIDKHLENCIDSNYTDVRKHIYNFINTLKDRESDDIMAIVYGYPYEIDPLIVFNKQKDKLYTTINISFSLIKTSEMDDIQTLYGIKLDSTWLFFLGSHLYLKRDEYKYNKNDALNFKELSYLAHLYRFEFISFNENGLMEIDNSYIENNVNLESFSNIIGSSGTGEERYARIINYYSQKKFNRLEYEQFLKFCETENFKKDSKRDLEFFKIFKRNKPVFETDEWKEYIKSKNKEK